MNTELFSKRRAIHQQCTGGEVTGEIPNAMWLGSKPDDELGGHYAQSFGWLGCLDAPSLMPAGSVIPVNIPYEIGGCGYEGNVSTNVSRDGKPAKVSA